MVPLFRHRVAGMDKAASQLIPQLSRARRGNDSRWRRAVTASRHRRRRGGESQARTRLSRPTIANYWKKPPMRICCDVLMSGSAL